MNEAILSLTGFYLENHLLSNSNLKSVIKRKCYPRFRCGTILEQPSCSSDQLHSPGLHGARS